MSELEGMNEVDTGERHSLYEDNDDIQPEDDAVDTEEAKDLATPLPITPTATSRQLTPSATMNVLHSDSEEKSEGKAMTPSETSRSSSKRRAIRQYMRERTSRMSMTNHKDQVHIIEAKRRMTSRPLGLRHLFKKPIVRQWYADGKLKRTAAERDSFRFEIFFDLIYVGVLHTLADAAVAYLDTSASDAIGVFILSYYPSYIIWSDIRLWLNHSGTDDVIQRFFLLFTMAILIGYTANVTGVQAQIEDDSGTGAGPYKTAVAFLLVSSLVRDLRDGTYAFFLPKFRLFYILSIAISLTLSFLFLPLAFVNTITWFIVLPPVALTVQSLAFIICSFLLFRLRHSKINKNHYFAALAYEHYIDRTSDFAVLVLGETVLSSTYGGISGQVGVQSEYGRAVLSLFIVFCLAWIYFAQASARRYVHAVRRHWFSQFVWHMTHFGLSAALVIIGASCGRLVTDTFSPDNQSEQTSLSALRWFLGGGLGVACANMGTQGHCHRSLDDPNSSLLHREVRLIARYLAGLIHVLLPLADGLQNPLRTLAAHAGTMGALLLVEVFGKLGAHAPDEDDEVEGKHILGPTVGLL